MKSSSVFLVVLMLIKKRVPGEYLLCIKAIANLLASLEDPEVSGNQHVDIIFEG